jgi:hypothetical protein
MIGPISELKRLSRRAVHGFMRGSNYGPLSFKVYVATDAKNSFKLLAGDGLGDGRFLSVFGAEGLSGKAGRVLTAETRRRGEKHYGNQIQI